MESRQDRRKFMKLTAAAGGVGWRSPAKYIVSPDRYTRVCITPIGVPEAWPESPPKKSLDEFIMTAR